MSETDGEGEVGPVVGKAEVDVGFPSLQKDPRRPAFSRGRPGTANGEKIWRGAQDLGQIMNGRPADGPGGIENSAAPLLLPMEPRFSFFSRAVAVSPQGQAVDPEGRHGKKDVHQTRRGHNGAVARKGCGAAPSHRHPCR